MAFFMNEHFATALVAICSALFSAIVAIVVPIRTKQIERKAQAEKIRHELYATKRIKCIEDFVQHVNSAIFYKSDRYSKDVSCDTILLYIDKSLKHFVDEICTALSNAQYDKASELLTEFCTKLQAIEK